MSRDVKENNIIGFQNLIQRNRCIFRKRNWQISELENNINNILLHAYLSDKTRNWLKEASNAVNPFKAHKESEAIGLSIKLLKWKIVNQKFMVNWDLTTIQITTIVSSRVGTPLSPPYFSEETPLPLSVYPSPLFLTF